MKYVKNGCVESITSHLIDAKIKRKVFVCFMMQRATVWKEIKRHTFISKYLRCSEQFAFVLQRHYKGNQKSIKSKFFCRFGSSWNVHKPNFTLILWGNPKLLGKKKSKFIIRSKFIVKSKFSCSWVFSLHRYFIETTTTDIDTFCKLVAIL